MKKSLTKSLMLGAIFATGLTSTAHATAINTGTILNTTTAGSPLTTNINATPAAVIRFEVGGANYITSSGQLSVSITVDTSTPTVTTGTAADQSFKDDTAGAAYFGYYLSTGVRSSNQNSANAMNIKVVRGAGETSTRSYYLLGNGTTTPTQESDLTVAPASATTFATTTVNSVHCGPSYTTNGLTVGLGCAGGSTVANMDVTQFVKVLYSDPAATPVISQLQFTAVSE